MRSKLVAVSYFGHGRLVPAISMIGALCLSIGALCLSL
jgi:hypothetical protein